MLQRATLADIPALYNLLQDSFPTDEYRPYDAQLALLSEPRYTLWTTAERNALISVWSFSDFAFIEHLAVAPACRNAGLGSQVLRTLLASLSCPVCLEAELPETGLARRRLAFYQRNGFVINEFPYLQPSYGAGRCPVPLCILSTGAALTEAQFESIRNTLYREVYKKTGRS